MDATRTDTHEIRQLRLLDEAPGRPPGRQPAGGATAPTRRRRVPRGSSPGGWWYLDPALRDLGRRRVAEAKALVARLRAEAPWERECA
jgi:hypothetical protein